MSDVHSPEVRSYNMSMIKSKNTKPELIIRKYLHSVGYRFRLHDKNLPGKPDIVLKKYKTIIFVHGCFWHGHQGCKYFILPNTRTEWWMTKINRTIKLDLENHNKLMMQGWKVITIFECCTKKAKREKTFDKLLLQLNEISL